MFDDTKFTKNELLSIFFIAKEASLGIFGLSLIISSAKSLIESIIAENSLFFTAGLASGKSLIVAFMYGCSVNTSATLKRFLPCIITVTFPSGIFKTRKILATVPVS